MLGARVVPLVLAALALAPAAALAHPGETALTAITRASTEQPCPGDGIRADRVIRGSFPAVLQGSYVMVPFTVPARTTAVRVKYCFDDNDAPTQPLADHTLDLGIYGPVAEGGRLWGPAQFRGWGGSSHPDVTVSAEGFSPETEYLARPRGHVPGKTTRGFRPGPIEPGRWAVELGVAAIAGREYGDSDGAVGWRVELEFADDPAFADEPYQPASYDVRPARSGEEWYLGDLHVHAEHSALGDATMAETFGYAFKPARDGGAGLDFVLLSDYVTDSAWGEIGRYQAANGGRLIGRSSEVITYRGHTNNHLSGRYVDHRTGPVYELPADGGAAVLRRPARPASAILSDVRAAGGLTQINHPTIFPSSVPLFPLLCRGCPWDYGGHETDLRLVDAIEVATGVPGLRELGGTGPNPFTVLALDFYERALQSGNHIAAVGVSDSHNAGRTPGGFTQSPIGVAATAVLAPELSEQAIRCGVKAGHTYAKLTGADGSDVRLEARAPGLDSKAPAIMGDTIRAREVTLTARVLRGDPGQQLVLVRDGLVANVAPVSAGEFVLRVPAAPGRWRLQVQRGTTIETVSTPIWVETPGAIEAPRVVSRTCKTTAADAGAPRQRTRLTLSPRGGMRVRCKTTGARARDCTVRAVLTRRGRRDRTIASGRARFAAGRSTVTVRLRPTRLGARLLAGRGSRGLRVTLRGQARGSKGTRLATARRTTRLHSAR